MRELSDLIHATVMHVTYFVKDRTEKKEGRGEEMKERKGGWKEERRKGKKEEKGGGRKDGSMEKKKAVTNVKNK